MHVTFTSIYKLNLLLMRLMGEIDYAECSTNTEGVLILGTSKLIIESNWKHRGANQFERLGL